MKIPLVTIVSLGIAATMGIAQGTGSAGQSPPASPMNALAERYVKLVLALGQHDADYVDAYYGPPQWQKEAESTKRPLADIDRDAATVEAALAAARPPQSAEETVRLRH